MARDEEPQRRRVGAAPTQTRVAQIKSLKQLIAQTEQRLRVLKPHLVTKRTTLTTRLLMLRASLTNFLQNPTFRSGRTNDARSLARTTQRTLTHNAVRPRNRVATNESAKETTNRWRRRETSGSRHDASAT